MEEDNALAPVALFVYNRPEHTRNCLESLRKNSLADRTTLYIFADGLPEGATHKCRAALEQTRRMLREEQWCGVVHIFETPHNKGLAAAITGGVSHVLRDHDRIIVLEDDLVLSPGFLQYMNDALSLYNDHQDVLQISGYMFPVQAILPRTFFLRVASSWGWGTWRRAWKDFNKDSQDAYRQILASNSAHTFDIDRSYPFMRMLKKQISGRINSWAIQWYAHVFVRNGLVLFPGMSLVQNMGFGKSGTHCHHSDGRGLPTMTDTVPVRLVPAVESSHARNALAAFFRRTPHSPVSRQWCRIRHVVSSLPCPWKMCAVMKLLIVYPRELLLATMRRPPGFSVVSALKDFPWALSAFARSTTPFSARSPWIVHGAAQFLGERLRLDMRVFEFGAGGSTLFFADRVAEVFSVEHDPLWYESLSTEITRLHSTNVSLQLAEPEALLRAPLPTDCFSSASAYEGMQFNAYVSTIDVYPDAFFDVILVDGRARNDCCVHAMPKLKPGGLLIFDNTDRAAYASVIERLGNAGYVERPFFGPTMGVYRFTKTTVFQKPA
jgi:hypothetical protein